MTLPFSWEIPVDSIGRDLLIWRRQPAHECLRRRIDAAVRAELTAIFPPGEYQNEIREVANRRIAEFSEPVYGWELVVSERGLPIGGVLVAHVDRKLHVVVDRILLDDCFTLVEMKDFTDRLAHRTDVWLPTALQIRGVRENESEQPFMVYSLGQKPAKPEARSWWQRLFPQTARS